MAIKIQPRFFSDKWMVIDKIRFTYLYIVRFKRNNKGNDKIEWPHLLGF